MNKTILMGRLTRDPEVRYAANDSGMAIVRYTLAVDRRRTGNDGQSADFINCVAFGKTGEFAEKYFRKGTKILISGRIQTGSYTNQENQRIYTTEVIVEDQEFAESKRASEEAAAAASADLPALFAYFLVTAAAPRRIWAASSSIARAAEFPARA